MHSLPPSAPSAPRTPVSRTVLAAVVAAGVAAGLALPSAAAAGIPAAVSGTGDSAREAAFAAASAEFGVPTTVLAAVSYAQTRWEAHAGQHSTDGGYGPMNLVDGTVVVAARAQERDVPAASTSSSASTASSGGVDTLGQAAALLGVGREALRTDPAANIRGGAALLARSQTALGLPTGATSDPGAWYAAVAAASGAPDETTATDFADAAYAVVTGGASRTTLDGQALDLPPTAVVPQTSQLQRLGLKKPKPNPNVECPRSVSCDWVPAPYQQLSADPTDYGNHDLAARDTKAGPSIDYIVIHDTEGSYATTLSLVQDPTYVSWHYTMRSADGHVAQHVATKDVAWHAGNWYVNAHAIGIEHEGFAADGATWYTESLYRQSAKLVRYLSKKYDIPLDRAHIIGHDQVPGTTPATVAGMHWDPGPYWDWQHYFDLLGAPLDQGTTRRATDIVRILPGFDRNTQQVTGCVTPGVACAAQGTNFVPLRTAPDSGAPLVPDVGLHPGAAASTTEVADIGARATAGVEYAVAGRRGDWTAIWYLGQVAWFRNPAARPTAVNVRRGTVAVPKSGLASVPVYGRAYPEAAAYAAYPGVPVQSVVPLQYALLAGQRYVVQDRTVSTDYYRASTYAGVPPADHVDVAGGDRYYQISFGHRIAYVRAADVDLLPAR